MNKLLLALGLIAITSTASAEVEQYKIDNKHSFANFTIRHVVSKASGTFTDVTGLIEIDPQDLSKSTVEAKIALASVDTGLAKRDAHIQKPAYLDAVEFGEMTFVSKKVVAKSATEGVITGDFTLHGVTKEISMPFKVLGFGADPWDGQRAGFEAATTIKASDYGYGWMKSNNAPVGDDIAVTLLIEGIKTK